MSNNKILVGILGVGQIAQFILEGLDKAKEIMILFYLLDQRKNLKN